MAAAREELRADHLGDVGRWLETAIVADDQHRLSTDALWEAALKTTGEQPGTDKEWCVGRHQIVDLVKQLHPKLPALKKMRVDGKVRYGWEHWRLATAEEAEEAARPEPVQSGLAADIQQQRWRFHPARRRHGRRPRVRAARGLGGARADRAVPGKRVARP